MNAITTVTKNELNDDQRKAAQEFVLTFRDFTGSSARHINLAPMRESVENLSASVRVEVSQAAAGLRTGYIDNDFVKNSLGAAGIERFEMAVLFAIIAMRRLDNSRQLDDFIEAVSAVRHAVNYVAEFQYDHSAATLPATA
jgi:hypothetical protein